MKPVVFARMALDGTRPLVKLSDGEYARLVAGCGRIALAACWPRIFLPRSACERG